MSLVHLLNPATYELCELELCDLSVNQDPPWKTKKIIALPHWVLIILNDGYIKDEIIVCLVYSNFSINYKN